MASIQRNIMEYKDTITSTGITPGEYKPAKIIMKRFIRVFRKVKDPRIGGMVTYPLHEILLIAFLAILGNASSWYDLEDFGVSHQKWLKKFLKLAHGIPSHDTFRRVFALIDPSLLQQVTVQFLIQNMEAIKKALQIDPSGYKQYCIDGKEENATGRKYNTREKTANLQTLHIYDASDGICLCSSLIDSKTNEIPVAQELLKMFQLKGAIVTFDSLHTQQKTINIIAAAKGEYVGGLKGNQPTLETFAQERFSAAAKEKIKKEAVNYYETIEKAHNQIEKRCYYLTNARQKMDGLEEFKKMRSFVCCETHTEHLVTGKKTEETRYYIASLTDVQLCAQAIRGHWSVEVQLHWHLDYSFGQDDNTTMDKNAFTNFSQMNKMALSLCKLFQSSENKSVRRIRKKFGWSLEDNLSKMLSAFDAETIKNALENAQNKKK